MARVKKPKETRKSYAIIGEGISEFFYFDEFRTTEKELLRKYNITLKPDKPKHPDYKDIIAKAESLLAKDYDVVFCLIDMDYINADTAQKQNYSLEKSRAISRYEEGSLFFIESNPAFEFWFLLHFLYTDRQFRNCDAVIAELKKTGRIEDYEKTRDYFSKKNLYQALLSNLGVAIKNGDKSIVAHAKNKDSSYTEISSFFKMINKKN